MKNIIFIKPYLRFPVGRKMYNMPQAMFESLKKEGYLEECNPDSLKEIKEDKEKTLKNHKDKKLKAREIKTKKALEKKEAARKKRLKACPECQEANEPCKDCE